VEGALAMIRKRVMRSGFFSATGRVRLDSIDYHRVPSGAERALGRGRLRCFAGVSVEFGPCMRGTCVIERDVRDAV
jgi:hypothetical protein